MPRAGFERAARRSLRRALMNINSSRLVFALLSALQGGF
jgi:hypothetical protein